MQIIINNFNSLNKKDFCTVKQMVNIKNSKLNGIGIILLSFLLLFINIDTVTAQTKYSNEFLAIGVGARSLAMGNSTIASANDVTSGYWNPAGLTRISSDWDVALMHSEYFAGIAKYDYGAAAYKYSDSLAFGLSIIRFGVDDIPNTLELIDAEGNLRYDRITSFSASDLAFIFTLAKVSNIKGLRYGANVKVIRRTAGDFASAWGFGLDLGAQYTLGNWEFGASARDITSTFNAWSFNTDDLKEVFEMTGNEIPENSIEYTMPRLMLGTSYKRHIYKGFSAMAELGADATFDGKRNVLVKTNFMSLDPHIGLELDYKKIVFIRAGVNNIQEARTFNNEKEMTWQPNLGVGIHFWKLTVDYAFTDVGDASVALYSHVFSLRLAISKPPEQAKL